MCYRMTARQQVLLVCFTGLGLGVAVWSGMYSLPVSSANETVPAYVIELSPDRLRLEGDVATFTNTIGSCTSEWLANMPPGSVILGVDPQSCDPADWDGGTATAEIFLPNAYTRTVITLKLSWPDRDGKGLHSPKRGRSGEIFLDGERIWDKRTREIGTFNDYYAAAHNPVFTTFVLTQSITHTLVISVTPNTAWDLSQIELIARPYPETFKGIGYSPYRDCQYPGGH